MNATLSPWTIAGLAFAMVFAALGVVSLLLFGLRAIARRSAARQEAASAIVGAGARPELVVTDELLAVLAAAAHAALGAPVRVRRVHVHREQQEDAWLRAGRMDIMISHRVGPPR